MLSRLYRSTTSLGWLSIALSAALLAACDRPEEPPKVGPSATAAAAPSGPRGAGERAPLGPRRDPAPASSVGEALGVHYLEIITGGAAATSELPLVVAIHGLGDTPEAYSGALSDFASPARLVLPRGFSDYHGGYSWFRLAGPLDSDETSKGIVAAAERLAAFIAELAKTKPTRGGPIVTGFSQGGALSFAIAALHPEVAAAVFPVSGWVAASIPAQIGARSPRSALAPFVALHGDADARVSVELTRAGVAKLVAAGLPVELRVFPGVGHSMPIVVRNALKALIAGAIQAPGAGSPP